jgi:hypothetical protein
MSLYLLFKLRQFSVMGFSGFEGRHYSVFESISQDMTEAVNLQWLVTALAHKYILNESVSHKDIPDSPSLESERRQIFFGTAIGIPTFFVRLGTPNRFLKNILTFVKKTRNSRRYTGYLRIHNAEYRKALVQILKKDGADLIEMFGMRETILDLEKRLLNPADYSAAGKLTKGILQTTGAATPMKLSGNEFNTAAEKFYRDTLRKQHLVEAFNVLLEDCKKLENDTECGFSRQTLYQILGEEDASRFLMKTLRDMEALKRDKRALKKMIHLILLTIHCDRGKAQKKPGTDDYHDTHHTPSIH